MSDGSQFLVHMISARRVLEIGTLGGYSTICLARGVGAGGFVLSLELSEHHAQVARNNVEVAGVADIVQIRDKRRMCSIERKIPSCHCKP